MPTAYQNALKRRREQEEKEKRSKVVVHIRTDSCWIWFERDDITPEIHAAITGKYLFFSPVKDILVGIAMDELRGSGFYLAKINSEQRTETDSVLCLYYSDDSRKHELAAKYGAWQNVRYRYWKSNEDTRAGIYSPQYLEKKKD
nr:hypothetical protein [Candidatus Sigynarchaeota archaeon]